MQPQLSPKKGTNCLYGKNHSGVKGHLALARRVISGTRGNSQPCTQAHFTDLKRPWLRLVTCKAVKMTSPLPPYRSIFLPRGIRVARDQPQPGSLHVITASVK